MDFLAAAHFGLALGTVVERLHKVVWVGLTLLMTTGALLVLQAWQYYFDSPVFWVKMCFIVALIVNSFFLFSIVPHTYVMPFGDIPSKTKHKLLIGGMVSTSSWLATIIIGYLWL